MSSLLCHGALLLLDTCGQQGSVALFQGGTQIAFGALPDRLASAALLGAVRDVLEQGGLRPQDLAGVGVVNGPGSFTGLRVGLAFAKGLCEAADQPLAAVSRLEVLLGAAQGRAELAVLAAGREEFYVRDAGGAESLVGVEALRALATGRRAVCAEAAVSAGLEGVAAAVELCTLTAADAFHPVCAAFALGGVDRSWVDANYVRNEASIYRRQAAGA